MSASLVQQKFKGGGGNGATETVTFDVNVAAGNAIAVWAHWFSGTVTLNNVTDNLGNSYTRTNNPTTGTGTRAAMAYATAIAAGPCTITLTFSADPGDVRIIVHECTGNQLVFDASDVTYRNSVNNATDAWKTTAASFTAGAVLNGFVGDEGFGNNFSAGTGFTIAYHATTEDASETKLAAGGSEQVTFTGDNVSTSKGLVGVLAFKESVVAPPTPVLPNADVTLRPFQFTSRGRM